MACILSCSFFCSSSTQVLTPSDAPAALKSSTFFLGQGLARQIENINLTLKTKSEIRIINGLVKDARAQLSKISTSGSHTPILARVGALSTTQLTRLQVKLQEIQTQLVDHGYVIRPSEALVDQLFTSMTGFERKLELLNGYVEDNKKSLGKHRQMELTKEIAQFTILLNQVIEDNSSKGSDRKDEEVDIKKGVSRFLIGKLSEAHAEKLQNKLAKFLPRIDTLIVEVASLSTIQPPSAPPLTRLMFMAPTTSAEPASLATSSPLAGRMFGPTPKQSNDDAGAGTKIHPTPTIASGPPSEDREARINRYVMRERQQRIKQMGRAPSEIECDSTADQDFSNLSELRPASPSASQAFSRVDNMKLKSFAFNLNTPQEDDEF